MACALEADPINQLEENLSCSVCLETLKDPRTLPCFHSFCKDCLEGVVKTCRDKTPRDHTVIRSFPCPNCRVEFTLDTDKFVADMPRNHFICNMVQATAILDRGTRIPCSHNCSQGFSVVRCVTCEKFLCRECHKDHNKYRGHDGHSVLSMEELSKPENRKKIQGKMYCNEHSGKKVKVYCETCDKLICKDCMDFKHLKQNHSCLLVKDVANNYKELLASNNTAMENALNEGNYFIEQLSLTTQRLDQDAQNAQCKIMRNKDDVLKNVSEMLDKKAETLLNEVEKIYTDKRTKLDKRTEETKRYVENIKQSVQLSKKLVEQGTEEEIISSQKMMLDNANNLHKKRPDFFDIPLRTSDYSYIASRSKKDFNDQILRSLENGSAEVNRENTERNYDRKVFAFGLPEGTTEGSVQIHFGKKANGGGDIESVTCLTGGKAIVVFKDPRVAEEVVKTEQTFKGKVLEVKLMKIAVRPSVEELRTEESADKKQARTVQVSGLPEGTTENSVQIHFGKKRNGGGDIESVTCLPGGKATVVFEDARVAEEVVKTERTFKGKVLEVKLMKIAVRPSVEELRTEESAEKKQARTVQVSGLPEGTTENSVHIHFAMKRNGGGDIENVTCLPGGKATVVFEDPRVAGEVVKTEQTFKGKVLEVKLMKIAVRPSVEELRTEESAEKTQARTVQVSGLPEGTTPNSVHIHFGKKRNGGGAIENVTCLLGGKATVVFEDPRVAEEVVKTEQTFKGKVLEVKLMKMEKTPSVEELRTEESAEKKQARTVQVSGRPEGTTPNSVHIHFAKKRNGGGDIESVTFLPGGKATVVFEDPRVAEEVVKTKQTFKGKVLEVKLMKMLEKPSVEELRTEESAEKSSGLKDFLKELQVFRTS